MANAAPVVSLDDVRYWVGSGPNRAGLAIDWDGNASGDSSLVWGFRWSGAATSFDMLHAVIVADDRLFARLGESGALGTAVRGLGYDANDDGQFALDDPEAAFDADGIDVEGPTDLSQPIDPTDKYAEGWFTGIWNFGTTNSNPWAGGGFAYSQQGASTRALVDGAWDSWAFTPTFKLTAFATHPLAAIAPSDFNSDDAVDGADFLIWQRGAGVAANGLRPRGDATLDGVIDAADLADWALRFRGSSTPASRFAATAIPELTSAAICIGTIVLFAVHSFWPRNSTTLRKVL